MDAELLPSDKNAALGAEQNDFLRPGALRQSIDNATKRMIAESLATIPPDKRGALIVIADQHGPRAHVAAKIDDHWKVALAAGVSWKGEVNGVVAIQGAW